VIVVVHAHPYPAHSRGVKALLGAIRDLPDLQVRSLYEMYPDFDIDAAAERKAMEEASAIVFLHPLYWYTVPALLKHWIDTVPIRGWAYGEGGAALRDKACLWAVTTGGDEQAYSAAGRHGHPMATFTPVMEQTAKFCGMEWQEPFIVHAAHQKSDAEMAAVASRFRDRLLEIAG